MMAADMGSRPAGGSGGPSVWRYTEEQYRNEATAAMDRLTVLRTFGPALTKCVRADASQVPYDNAKRCAVRAAPMACLSDIAGVLDRLTLDLRSAVTRGRPAPRRKPFMRAAAQGELYASAAPVARGGRGRGGRMRGAHLCDRTRGRRRVRPRLPVARRFRGPTPGFGGSIGEFISLTDWAQSQPGTRMARCWKRLVCRRISTANLTEGANAPNSARKIHARRRNVERDNELDRSHGR